MAAQHTKNVLIKAEKRCFQSGSKLTDKRSRLLELLVNAEAPLSAYELVDQYNKKTEQSMPPMSAYRILDFLISEQLAHKLTSENKFIACSHITCSHEHGVPQFLICRNCHQVKEISIQKSIVDDLSQQVDAAGFSLMNSQLELDCLCKACASN